MIVCPVNFPCCVKILIALFNAPDWNCAKSARHVLARLILHGWQTHTQRMPSSTEISAPIDDRLVLKQGVGLHRRPISAEATVVSVVLGGDVEGGLFEFPLEGAGGVGVEVGELFGDVVLADAGGEVVGAGCAGGVVCAGGGVGEEAEPGWVCNWRGGNVGEWCVVGFWVEDEGRMRGG